MSWISSHNICTWKGFSPACVLFSFFFSFFFLFFFFFFGPPRGGVATPQPPSRSASAYVQMRVVAFIEDDFEQVFVRLFLSYWFKQSIYCRINNPKWNLAMFSRQPIPIPELKMNFKLRNHLSLISFRLKKTLHKMLFDVAHGKCNI